MMSSISVNKNSRGRPKKVGGVHPVTAVRLPADLAAKVDAWGKARELSRSEAIRRLVEQALAADQPSRSASSKTAARGAELAGKAINSNDDLTTTPDERTARKRRILKGPGTVGAIERKI